MLLGIVDIVPMLIEFVESTHEVIHCFPLLLPDRFWHVISILTRPSLNNGSVEFFLAHYLWWIQDLVKGTRKSFRNLADKVMWSCMRKTNVSWGSGPPDDTVSSCIVSLYFFTVQYTFSHFSLFLVFKKSNWHFCTRCTCVQIRKIFGNMVLNSARLEHFRKKY